MFQTPLIEQHRALNARLVDFAGWEMPVQYAGIIDEAKAVRSGVGIFDVSHMGRVWVRGECAFDFLQNLTTNDIGKLCDSQAQYSLMCYPDGGVVDDIILYRIHVDEFLIVWNASNRDKDFAWAKDNIGSYGPIELIDTTFETGMIAVQGPAATAMVEKLSGSSLMQSERFSVQNCQVAGVICTACRTGYTGEDGFELIIAANDTPIVWQALIDAGAAACGLAARDVLRVEAGLPLYGHELTSEINPIEAGLGWVVARNKRFIGSEVINQVRAEGPKRKCVGIVMETRIVPREGYPILLDGAKIGSISSGVFSPALDRGIGFAFVASEYSEPNHDVSIEIREKLHPARLSGKRFLKDT